jgi:tetratricopeptide (TPR) repeat protein
MEYDRSIDNFTKVLEVAPYGKDNDLVYYNLGMAYFKQRQYDESIYQFTKALELIPENGNKRKFNILEWRANAFQQKKEFDNAIKDYSDAIQPPFRIIFLKILELQGFTRFSQKM